MHRGAPNACVPGLHLIALDKSDAIRQGGRLAWAKNYAARLIEQVTRADDQVALPCFGCQGEELLLPPGPARPGTRGRQCTCAPREWWWHAIGSLPARGRVNMAHDHGLRVPDQATCLWRRTDDYTFEQLGLA